MHWFRVGFGELGHQSMGLGWVLVSWVTSCHVICSYLWFIALFRLSRRMVTSVAPHLVFLGFSGEKTGMSYTLASNVTLSFVTTLEHVI